MLSATFPDAELTDSYILSATGNPVPVPAAIWLLGSGLAGLAGLRRTRR